MVAGGRARLQLGARHPRMTLQNDPLPGGEAPAQPSAPRRPHPFNNFSNSPASVVGNWQVKFSHT